MADNADPNTPDTGTPEGRGEVMAQQAALNAASVPDKFKNEDGSVNVVALAQSYTALEKRMSGGESPDPTPEPASPSPTESSSALSAEANTLEDMLNDPPAPKVNEVWAKVEAELAAGALTPETRQAALGAGMPETMIAKAEAGAKLQSEADMKKAAEIVGGEDVLKATLAWAKEKYPDPQARATLIAQIKAPGGALVLRGLHAQAVAEGGIGSLVDTSVGGGGGPAPGQQILPFKDEAERHAVMSDPKYYSDPNYRAIAERRMMATAGIDPRLADQIQ